MFYFYSLLCGFWWVLAGVDPFTIQGANWFAIPMVRVSPGRCSPF